MFIDLFEDIVKRNGNKTAIVADMGNRTVTYAELNLLSGKIASALVQRGVKKEDVVPVLLPRGIEYIAAEIGIIKAGGAFLGLDLSYPQERTDYIKKDCGCSFLIDMAFIEKAMVMEPLSENVRNEKTDAAFALYTSGSTGNPKGIIHEHKSFLSGIERHREFYQLTSEDIYASNTPFTFVAVVFDVFLPLSVGAELHIVPDSVRKDIVKLEQYIKEHSITACFLSPQMLKRFQNKSSSLRRVLTGSEKVSGVSPGGYEIISIYGSSETIAGVTSFAVDKKYENTPIGKAVEGYAVYLLDENGSEVKNGEEGEICIAGIVARGYINLPDETRKHSGKTLFPKMKTIKSCFVPVISAGVYQMGICSM